MDDRQRTEEDAVSVDEPSGRPPDEGDTYDPAMTEGDEANIPPDSAPDPNASPESRS